MSPTADVAVVTEQCPECPRTFSGPATGKANVKFKIAAHRAQAHGYVSPKRGTRASSGRGPGRPRKEESGGQVISVLHDMAEDAGGRKSRKPPTADELSRAFGRGLGIVSITVASYAVETDPGIPDGPAGEEERRRLVDYLSLPPAAAVDVMRPVGKAVAGTGMNERYGRTIVENVDVVGALGEVVKLGLHWRRYFRDRQARAPIDARSWPAPGPAPGPVAGTVEFTPGGAPPSATSVGNLGVVDLGFGPQSPPPQAGVLLTPGMLREAGVVNEATMGPPG